MILCGSLVSLVRAEYSCFSSTLTSSSNLNSGISTNHSHLCLKQKTYCYSKIITINVNININISRQIISNSHITMADSNSRFLSFFRSLFFLSIDFVVQDFRLSIHFDCSFVCRFRNFNYNYFIHRIIRNFLDEFYLNSQLGFQWKMMRMAQLILLVRSSS